VCLKSKYATSAFSLVEVLLVLVILMLLAKQTWTSNLANLFARTDYEQLALSQHSLARGLTLARQFAVQAKKVVSLCGGNYLTFSCDGGWSSGWYIQSGVDIKTYHLFPSDIQIRWSGFPANKKQIDFYESGHSGYQNGTFYLCQYGFMARIVLNQSGRFYLMDIISLSDADEGCE